RLDTRSIPGLALGRVGIERQPGPVTFGGKDRTVGYSCGIADHAVLCRQKRDDGRVRCGIVSAEEILDGVGKLSLLAPVGNNPRGLDVYIRECLPERIVPADGSVRRVARTRLRCFDHGPSRYDERFRRDARGRCEKQRGADYARRRSAFQILGVMLGHGSIWSLHRSNMHRAPYCAIGNPELYLKTPETFRSFPRRTSRGETLH